MRVKVLAEGPRDWAWWFLHLAITGVLGAWFTATLIILGVL